MRVVLRVLTDQQRAIIEPHVRARREATEAIRTFAILLAPDLMAQPGVVFDPDAGAWVQITPHAAAPAAAPPET